MYCRCDMSVKDLVLKALEAGDYQLLAKLLEDTEPSITGNIYPTKGFRTLLQLAIEIGDLKAVSLLLKVGATPDLLNPALQVTPLHVAARLCNKDVLELLLSAVHLKDLEARDRSGRTPLLVAASKGDLGLNCLHLLLGAGSSVLAVDNCGGKGVLQHAIKAKCWNAVKSLLDHGAPANSDVLERLEDVFGKEKLAILTKQKEDEPNHGENNSKDEVVENLSGTQRGSQPEVNVEESLFDPKKEDQFEASLKMDRSLCEGKVAGAKARGVYL